MAHQSFEVRAAVTVPTGNTNGTKHSLETTKAYNSLEDPGFPLTTSVGYLALIVLP